MSESSTVSFSQRLREWFRTGFLPEPLAGLEWFLMRASFAALVLWTFNDGHPFEFAGQPAPVGIARWVDLSWLHQDHMYEITFGVAALCCVLYSFGIALPFVLPALTLLHIAVRTFNNSQGFTHHGVQLVSMVLLVQTLVIWWKRRESKEALSAWLWYYSRGIVLLSYVASAITKLIVSHGQWVWKSQYLGIEIVKSWRFEYLARLDPAFAGDPPAAFWLSQHPLVAMIVFGSGFFLELFAFLGMRDRVWSTVFGLAIVAMHFCIEWLMQLSFTNHCLLCLIFLINPLGWACLAWQRNKNPQPAVAA